jgi:hypothetical protein
VELDLIVYKLTDGDLSKSEIIENQEINKCMSYYYINRVKELNRMKYDIAEIERIRKK